MDRRARPTFALVLVSLLAAASAGADVTLRQLSGGKALGMSGSAETVTYIKGARMRTETPVGGKTRVMIFDVDTQKVYMFDVSKKEGDAWDMGQFGAEMAKSIDSGGIVSTLKPNGQSRTVSGQSAAGFDLLTIVPATMGPGGPKMTVRSTGTAWIVKGAPGSADYATFYKAAADKGFIFGDPRAAKGNAGNARATAEMYRQFAAIGGIPYEIDMKIAVEGEGPLAMMAGMMGADLKTTVQSIDTAPLGDDLFAPPADMKLKERK